jgi:DnaJ-class molecular chaperone
LRVPRIEPSFTPPHALASARADKNNGASEQFVKIQCAYDILGDATLRRRYDLTLEVAPVFGRARSAWG